MKEKTYTEEEIFKIIDDWFLGGSIILDYDRKEELKKRFMTPQGFRKAIEKAGLKGEKFD